MKSILIFFFFAIYNERSPLHLVGEDPSSSGFYNSLKNGASPTKYSEAHKILCAKEISCCLQSKFLSHHTKLYLNYAHTKFIIAENQIIDLDIEVNAIPKDYFREQPKANGRGDFLTLDLVAEIEVSKTVTFRVKYGDVVANTYSTKL